ncbi:MAG TPA: DUF4340 domain-containing protein [Parasegetibacter sp.]|jgi:hypothetical protein
MKNANNKRLLIFFIGLVVVYLGIRFVNFRSSTTNLHEVLLRVDTSKVATIKIYPYSEGQKEMVFTRKDQSWIVSNGQGIEDVADSSLVNNLLQVLPGLYADRIMTKRKSQWGEYRMEDTSTSRVVIADKNNNVLADFRVRDGARIGSSMGGGTTYVRLSGDDKVYMVDGYLNSSVDRPFVRWRESTIIRLKKDTIMSIAFPGIANEKITRSGDTWMIDGRKADSAANAQINRYVNSIKSRYSWSFEDQFRPAGESDARLELGIANGSQVMVRAWRKDDSTWVINSSLREKSYYNISDSALRKDYWPLGQ